MDSCLSQTKIQKQSATSKPLRIPRRSTAKNFLARLNLSGSYARRKNASNPTQRTNRANRRSSNADRFDSRFSALSTFDSVPIRAVARMFKVGKGTIIRVIRETGEAFANYMDKELRDLPCKRIEMDEQWQYVGCHKGRMPKPAHVYERGDQTRGDFWLWACIDADTKLVLSHQVGRRDYGTARSFVYDVRERVAGPVQIATDNNISYAGHIRGAFGYEGYSYGTETKVFGEPMMPDETLARFGRNEGVRKMETVDRKAVIGSPDLGSVTTAHIERLFLTVRQELKRFQRKGLGYSKDLATHKAAVAISLGVYNFVRAHKTLGTTPAVAAGVEFERWTLETGSGNDRRLLGGKRGRGV
jgi:IS1 family transposase